VDQEGREAPGAGALVNAAFGMRVTAQDPIVAERSLYWGVPSTADPLTPRLPWSDGHATAGVTAPAARWAFAEGGQDFITSSPLRFQTFVLVSNPNPNPILVRATFLREDGTGIQRDRCVAGSSRANFWTADFPELSNRRFSSVVESVASGAQGSCGVPTIGGEEFVAERAMYWGETFEGGHANVGIPWSTPVAVPSLPVDPLTATLNGLVSAPGVREGRLSGGEWVSLTVANAAIGDTEVWFGNRRSPDVVFLSATQLRARTPVRTAASGFGNGGPVPVEVRSASRTVSAGTFTFTFRVLAFGDSITWGTSSLQLGTANMWQSFTVSSPYPARVKSALAANRFGQHVLVTNAGVPGERAIGEGEIRMPRCLVTDPGPACLSTFDMTANPDDFTRPFDVVVLLHGVNDLFWGRSPTLVRNALRNMVLAAKAPPLGGLPVPVLMTRLSSYKPRPDGSLIPGIENVPELNRLIWELTEEQSLQRLDFGDAIAMSFDGLHPSGQGYDQMAQMVVGKLLSMFPP
jgi:lysophospholipase L1-like esterase